MNESLQTKLTRLKYNMFPAYFSTGARLTYLAADHTEVHVELPLSWRTRNYFGTTFGGSIYAALDPILVMMFFNVLGRDYIIWDKAATIHFKRPGRETLFAKFVVTREEIAEIKAELSEKKSVDRTYRVAFSNKAGKTHAIIEKTLYIAGKQRNKH